MHTTTWYRYIWVIHYIYTGIPLERCRKFNKYVLFYTSTSTSTCLTRVLSATVILILKKV
jgi:hypothetical protein